VPLVKVKPTPAGAQSSRWSTPTCSKGGRTRPWWRNNREGRPQRQRPHTVRHQAAPQAALTALVDFAAKGRHFGQGERLEYIRTAREPGLAVQRRRRAPLHHRAQGPDGANGSSFRVEPRSRRETRCRCATSPSDHIHCGPSCSPAAARSSRARRNLRCSSSRERRYAQCAPALEARYARFHLDCPRHPSGKSATRSTALNRSASGPCSLAGMPAHGAGVAMNPIDHRTAAAKAGPRRAGPGQSLGCTDQGFTRRARTSAPAAYDHPVPEQETRQRPNPWDAQSRRVPSWTITW